MTPPSITPEAMTQAQKVFTSLLSDSLTEVGVDVSHVDLLDCLARLGLEIHPISELYGTTTSNAYLEEIGLPSK